MAQKPKRPPSVWLTQIFLAILSIFPGWLIFLGLVERFHDDDMTAGATAWLVLAVVLSPLSWWDFWG